MTETLFKGPLLSLIENEIKKEKNNHSVKHYIACSNLVAVLKFCGSHVGFVHLSQVAVQNLLSVQGKEWQDRLCEKEM